MKKNKKREDTRFSSERLAGGFGALAAKQSPEALLRRSVMANLLWEDLFYEDGVSAVENIKKQIPLVDPQKVAEIAIEARHEQKLRHVPLLIAREMARIEPHKKLVGDLLPKIIMRADELSEFLAIYFEDGKQPISKQVKLGLSRAFDRFDAYQLAKYNRDAKIRLRDVMFLVHPKPAQGKEALYKQIANDTLPTPDTWEVGLSTGQDKKETFARLIKERKLGALAFLRNLRLMEEAGVDRGTIMYGFETINPKWLVPLNYFAAAQAAPNWIREIEALMLRALGKAPKLPGMTIFVVDVSGSMSAPISGKSRHLRIDVAAALTTLAAEMCDQVAIYATAGSDGDFLHQTERVKAYRGFALADEIKRLFRDGTNFPLGGGGIFTRQCLEYIRSLTPEDPDRIIVISDSQDCDYPDRRVPKPFGRNNYIIDVSAHRRGINYKGVWTAEISGWSEHFLKYIAAFEGVAIPETEDQ